MGLALCKSLCTSSKPQSLKRNGVSYPQTPVSTIQNAVTSQESQHTAAMAATATSINEQYQNESEEDYVEKIACNESDIVENEMLEIDMGNDKKVLLIKQHGKITAVGAKCSHNGAPLVMGALGEGRIRCPWHGACFNIETGDIEDFPGLDSIPCFKVIVEKGQVKVRAKKSDLASEKRVKSSMFNQIRSGELFVIVGGGPSGQTCAETLRQNGFSGRILMICKEAVLPYNRMKLSKSMSSKLKDVQLRSQEFYDENHIEVTLDTEVTALDTERKELTLSSGNKLKYDKLYLATGSKARKPDIPGRNLENVFTLRDMNDAQLIDSKLKSTSHVVILGSNFISMEVAAYCVDKVSNVTIISRHQVPFHDSFGEIIGNRIKELFESHGVVFHTNSGAKSFVAINQEKRLSAIKLINDTILKADICIVGIGSELNTDFLRSSALSININGSIDTNLYLESSVADVYIGGDIANSPVYSNDNRLSSIGHYATAQYHGRVAGLNMIGLKTELQSVPYFSTYLLGNCFTYTGSGSASEIYIDGDLKELKFIAFYFDENENVIAMSTCQPNKKTAEFAEMLSQGKHLSKKDLFEFMGINGATPTPIKESSPRELDYVEKIACNESDIVENEMLEIDMGNDKKVLLIKQHGKITAVGAKCSHNGAPLVMGALGEGRIRCPWHGACFNIENGDIEDFPGLDSIPCFKVIVEKGQVKVRAKKSDLANEKRVKSSMFNQIRSGELFVIVGGGPSGQTCAETLRQNGSSGRILMVCKEAVLPYDRMKLSKSMSSKLKDVQLRSQEFYDENHIEVTLDVEATVLNAEHKELSLSSGNKLKYDKLYLATGSSAKTLDVPGINLKNVFTLRSLENATAIASTLSLSANVVILGSSLVGMEVAAYCVDKVAKVTVISKQSAPLIDSFGEAIGNRIMQLFKSRNVEFIMNCGIKSFLGGGDYLEEIELTNGNVLIADACIVAIGSKLNTDFLRSSALSINVNGSIDTNLYLGTNIADIYVGGDIANSPVYSNNNQPAVIGHYATAQYHGHIAGLNMSGTQTELKAVPYFSTAFFGDIFTYTGHGRATEIFIEGDLEALKFVAFYFDEDENVIGMSSSQPDKSIAEFAEKLAQGYQFHKSDIEWVHDNE